MCILRYKNVFEDTRKFSKIELNFFVNSLSINEIENYFRLSSVFFINHWTHKTYKIDAFQLISTLLGRDAWKEGPNH